MANKTRKVGGGKLPMLASTLHGLHRWHDSLFEKVGYMVLAKAKGRTQKIVSFKASIDYFLKSVDHVSKEYQNQNKKHDLNVLRMNMMELKDFVNRNF